MATMDSERFKLLVKDLEAYAKAQPETYRLKVIALAALGYAYILGMLLALLTLILIFAYLLFVSKMFDLAAKASLPIAVLLYAIVSSLSVRVPAPTGISVNKERVPELFRLLDEVRRKTGAPIVDDVLITDEYNAFIIQRPRLGLLGWPKNYLVLGMSLMESLSQSQFESVLAHELGHLSVHHGRLAGTIYGVRSMWARIMQPARKQSLLGQLFFERFNHWYAPFFSAYTFVLARTQEFQADQRAVEMVGCDVAASALVAVRIKGYALADSWDSFTEQVRTQPFCPSNAFSQVHATVSHPVDYQQTEKRLRMLLGQRADVADTHPSLMERLLAIYQADDTGYLLGQLTNRLQDILSFSASAADTIFGAEAQTLRKQLDARWMKEHEKEWQAAHQSYIAAEEELEKLEQRMSRQPLTVKERFRMGQIRWVLKREEEQNLVDYFEKLAADYPMDSDTLRFLGSLLLDRNDERGLLLLDQARKLDSMQSLDITSSIMSYHWKVGDVEAYEQCARELESLERQFSKAMEERFCVTERDDYRQHSLGEEEISQLKEELSKLPAVKEVYVVAKVVTAFSDKPMLITVIVPDFPWYKPYLTDPSAQLKGDLQQALSSLGGFFFLIKEAPLKLRRFVERSTPVYQRSLNQRAPT